MNFCSNKPWINNFEVNKYMADSEESSDTMALNLGHEGVGDNCFEKVLNQTGKFLVAGKPNLCFGVLYLEHLIFIQEALLVLQRAAS